MVSELSLEDEVHRRVREIGSATFARMQERITQLQAENATLKRMLGVPANTPVLIPDSAGESDDPLDIGP